MKITTLDRSSLQTIREAVNAALVKVSSQLLSGDGLNVELRLGNASYNETNATFKLEVATIGKRGVNKRTITDFERYAVEFGLKSRDLGRVISYMGHRYKIVGLKPRASRFPVLAQRTGTGRTFRLPVEAVR